MENENCSVGSTVADDNRSKPKRLDGLTFLRFLAAFYVFVFHFDLRFPISMSLFEKNIIQNGAIAMPVFFMLSGFVLTYSYKNCYLGFREFYSARVARIYPAYVFCVLVCLPLIPVHDLLIGPRLILSMLIVIFISFILIQAWLPNLFHFWHISGSWSVSVEMFLYLIYPVSRSLVNLTTPKLLTAMTLLVGVSALLIPSLHMSFSQDLPFPVFYTIPPYRLAEFVVGCGIAILFLRHGGNSFWLIPGFAIIPLLGVWGASNFRYMMFNGILIPLIACLIFGMASAGFSNNKMLAVILTNPISRYLGETSYSFFLMQLPLMIFADQHKEIFYELTTVQLFVLFFLINQAAASFSYHFVERTGQRYVLRCFRNNALRLNSALHSNFPNATKQ